MDTRTVMKIIEMLENKQIRSCNEWKAERIENIIQAKNPDTELHTKYMLGVVDGIALAVLHLQNYIDAQVSYAESQSTEQ